ncbi:MAG: hypothetical protein Tsb0015_14030 [Simkaniaceae bacterium]
MVRISKKGKERNASPKRPRFPSPKTGPLKENLPKGFKEHENALQGDNSSLAFIPKIK